ncbi:MAG: Zn-dependent exopeptidase M28 [Armatimonadetes bacterium]|nr:Zn-dependent exopeptidase M28 [Armatimonadota bacterium]
MTMESPRARRVLHRLCDEIGPRWAGSAAEQRAGEYLAEELRDLGLAVSLSRVRYIGWEPLGEPELQIREPETLAVPSCPHYFSAPTDGTVQGRLVPAGRAVLVLNEGRDADDTGPPHPARGPEKLALVDDAGEPRGFVVLGSLDTPRPGGTTQFAEPVVLAGRALTERWPAWCAAGRTVRASLRLPARYRPDAWSYNVVGELSGRPDQLVIVGAHYDSLYNSPGAFDNGSGVTALMAAAEGLVRKPPEATVRFCLFGAEELDFQGSRHYVLGLKERGELPRVTAMVNLDAVGNPAAEREKHHNVRVTHGALEEVVTAALAEFRIPERYGWEAVLSPFPWRKVLFSRGSDYCFFAQEGVPAISCGANASLHGHSPADTIANMDPDVSVLKGEMAAWMVRQLGRGAAAGEAFHGLR